MNQLENNYGELLQPMFQILDTKNITKGITIKIENQKLYVCFERDYLSLFNQYIIEQISFVYCETLFYSDNEESPNSDRLEYWCPDDWYDRETHITERCHNKKLCVLELDLNDQFTVLGTTIMLANAFQIQDPLELKANEKLTVFDEEDLKRRDNYISSGRPDLGWVTLEVYLNKNNPLRDNPYASFIHVCDINSPVSDCNIITALCAGIDVKKSIRFCMDEEDLAKEINNYFNPPVEKEEHFSIEGRSLKRLAEKN